MNTLPDPDDIRRFRRYLDDNAFSRSSIEARLGSAAPPGAGSIEASLDATREATAANALLRLFLLGTSIDAAMLEETLDPGFVELCLDAGLFERNDGRTAATISIVPVDDLLFASDAFRKLGTPAAREFVLPASTHAAQVLRRITFRDRVGSTLDIGTGCGLHALLASRHSNRVIATDISEAALRYTEFNSCLNDIDNVECRAGNLFDPVAGESFDLIVSNPPFVIGPGEEYVYRDSPLELDGFCAALASAAPAHLEEGGHLQMLGEWAGIEGEDWQGRIAGWLEASGCDAWILTTGSVPAGEYVRMRLSDIKGPDDAAASEDWFAYLADRNVDRIHAGIITLRKRTGANWQQMLAVSGDIGETASFALRRSIDAQDFLQLCDDDASLLDAVLRVSPKVATEPTAVNDAGQPTSVMLRRGDGLPVVAELDLAVMVFLQQIDGQRTLSEAIARFSELTKTDIKNVQGELVAAARLFVTQGFVEPV
ncbi:MAG: methyltransferase [Woeseiaceae bacterium]|nr:methyltransferase [Woeseiaceae bacterium]